VRFGEKLKNITEAHRSVFTVVTKTLRDTSGPYEHLRNSARSVSILQVSTVACLHLSADDRVRFYCDVIIQKRVF
jgi:hypothetical protein